MDRMVTMKERQPINLKVVRVELDINKLNCIGRRPPTKPVEISLPPLKSCRRKPSIIPSPPSIKHVHFQKKDVKELVEQLLDEIYGNQRDWSTNSFEYSHGSTSAASLASTQSNYGEQTDSIERSYLESLELQDLRAQSAEWQERLRFTGERLARCVRARDRLKRQQKRLCAAFSVVLRHITGDAGARFGAAPEGGEGGYAEWLHAMRLVARLPAGVPLHFRRKLWLTLAERHLSARGVDWPAAERACFRGTAQPDDTELSAQILKDLHRTGCSLFCGTEARENQAMLRRVLLAYARWNKEVGYCQGFNMIAAIILEVMDKSESDSLKVMIYLVEAVLPEGYFADDLRGLSADMAAFRDLLRLRLPRLANHMDHLQRISDGGGVEPPLPDVFTMQWFLTLYATWLPRDSLLRIWDLTLLDGNEILLLTALAIWNMLQDRILSARSADEYYCCMGGGAGAIWEGGETLVAKVVAFGTLPELPKLRSLHRYQVAPPAPPTAPPVFQPPLHSAVQSMTKRGLRLFYSEDEGDSSDDGNKMALATVIPRRENRSGAGDRLSLDIGALKRQYARLRERQRQAHVILAAACARHAAVGVPTSPTSLTVNSLLLGKSAIVSSRGRRLGPPPGAVPPTRRSSSSNVKTESETLSNSADTISWNEEKSRKSMSRRNSVKWKDLKKDKVEEKVRKASIDLDETGDGVIVSELEANEMIASLRSRSSSESSSYSTQSASSTDTSLCDDNAHGTDSDREQDDDKHKNNSKHSKDIKYSQTYDENKIVQDCASKHSPVHFTKNSPDHFTKQSPKHSPEDIVTKYSAEHLTQHSPEHFMKHSSQHFIKHSPEHFMTRSPEHFTKHSPEHFTKHSPEHFTKHSPEHFTKHSPEHFTKHSPEHFTKHSPEHYTKHSPEHYTKHSPEHYTKHSPEYFVKHSPEHFTKHSPKHYTQHSPADITEHLPTHTTKQSPEHFTKHSLTEHSPIHFTELKPTERQPIKDITDYLDSAAGEPLRTYIDGFETILQDNPIKSTETDKYHATSPFKSLYSPNTKSDNEPLQRLGGINYEINVKSNESIRPTNFPNIKELTDLSPLTLSPCNYRLDHKSPYDYEFESNFKRPSTSKPDIISRPPDIIDSLTMYPNFVPDIDLSEKNISDIESPPRSPGAESIIVSEDEPPIPLKIDKYFEHSPEFFGARFTDPNNADIPNRRATRRSFPRNPKKPDSLTLQSSFNEKLIRDEETERASSLPQSHSFGNTEDLNYERNERDITQSISSLKKQETPEGYSITQQQSPEISKQYSSIINQPSSEISKECSENMSPKNYILQTGRKNSERALQIIQENSKILSRILTKQHNPDTNDITKYESVKSGNNTNEIQQKYYHCIPQRSIEAKLIESPILKESSSDSLLGYRKNNPILESHDKTEFVRIRPISIDDPFSLDIRSTNQGITTKTTKTPSTECLVNKTDLYGWENKGFLVKSEYRPKSEIYEKEAIGFLDNVTHDFPSPENLKIDTKTTPLPDWAHHSYSCEHTASVTLPSTESRDVSTYDKQFTSTDYNQFSSKYNDYVISKASDICSKTVDQGPKVCENLSKTDNSQVSEFAHKVTSSISFTYEPSAEDDSPTGAKSNSSDTLCQITSLDQVSTPISPKIFPNKDISVLSKTYAEKSDRTVLESDDTCSAITPLVETETISSLSYPRSPSTGSYHPFPTRPALRTPKEIGVRLGMYPKDAISSPQK